MKKLVLEAGLVMAAFALLVAVENVVIGSVYRSELVASWEEGVIAGYASPIALALLVPCALFLVAAARTARTKGGARLVGMLAGVASVGLVFSLDSRSLQSTPIRWGLAAACAAGSVIVVQGVARRWQRVSARAFAAIFCAIGAIAAIVNATVLVRLYAPLHAGLLAITVIGAASLARLFAASARANQIGAAGGALGIIAVLWTPHAAARLGSFDNVRLVLLEHAPALGQAVRAAAQLSPPPPLEEGDDAAPRTTGADMQRALDWSGRDVILVSIDALRADHVGAYGYARATTPNIDALAHEGVTFSHAYCPTPHTSYSVTSMMTGKYMRPLLRMDLGEDSETFAGILRRYGYKTAGFYPPAVFFIDEQRFGAFRDRALDFEFRKVEFAEPQLRVAQIETYLARAKEDVPMFLWLHVFEPHEPYVFHDEHPFGDPARPTDIDRYDSEIATADALVGSVVELVRKKRKDPVFIVTADHGEEFGDHGGRHHGTTVFEEQVRVPLVVAGRGIAARAVDVPVQTIDILPTTLSALGIPRPARIRGRDLGAYVAGHAVAADDHGNAFAETDDFALVARGSQRLVCERKVGACTLYDVASDPGEHHDLSAALPEDVAKLKAARRTIENDHGRFESGAARALPEALRRGLQGDADTAEDVATLLDDARVDIRRTAAEVSFKLHAPQTIPSLRRAEERADDLDVKRFVALALVRAGDPPSPLAEELLHAIDPTWRKLAALSFAERGDARGAADLVRYFNEASELDDAKVALAAIVKIHAKDAAPALLAKLSDVRLRPYVAQALGDLGQPEARAPLLRALAEERYPGARTAEARALLALGEMQAVYPALRRFAGVPEPMVEAIAIAEDAQELTPEHGAVVWPATASARDADVAIGPEPRQRLVVRMKSAGAFTVVVEGAKVELQSKDEAGTIFIGDFDRAEAGARAHIALRGGGAAPAAVWIVPLAADVPPPPPTPWDAGPDQNEP